MSSQTQAMAGMFRMLENGQFFFPRTDAFTIAGVIL
jgi:hypothetical protein